MTAMRMHTMQRWLPFSGAILAAACVALSAYASHGADVAARDQLALAAAFGFAHGLALAALGPHVSRRLGATALLALLFGVLLFSGSLVAAQLLAAPTRLAPVGGMLLIAGWLLYAVDALRK
jgi:uncharacterized membrane protein YgdD (TMEM256/DUF423 family)